MLTFKCCRHQNSNEILTRTQSHHFITGKFNLDLRAIKYRKVTFWSNHHWIVYCGYELCPHCSGLSKSDIRLPEDLRDIITELLTDDMTDTDYRQQGIIFRLTRALSVCHNSSIALNDSIAPVSNFLSICFKNKNYEVGAGARANDKIHLKFPKWIIKTGLHHAKGGWPVTLKCKIFFKKIAQLGRDARL